MEWPCGVTINQESFSYLEASSIATATATVIQTMEKSFAEHIVCVFPENIITRFDVSVNDVSGEFAEMLHSNYYLNLKSWKITLFMI